MSEAINIEALWNLAQYEMDRGREPSHQTEKHCFFLGVEAGLRIVMLMNKTFDIEDESERFDAEEAVWAKIDAAHDQVSDYLLTTRNQSS